MNSSKVFFANMRVAETDSVPAKLTRLLKTADIASLDLEGKYVAVKAHLGEMGNVSYLKPAYARTIVSLLKELGAKPFVTDCSTLYPGMRADAINHLKCAAMNGFNTDSLGCPVIIGDGLRGTDEVLLPVPEGGRLKQAKIGRAIMDADVVVTLTHAKGCFSTAYGGAIKNLAMGCASKGGKMDMHADGRPVVIPDVCVGCGKCLESCGQDAISVVEGKAAISDACAGCGHCIAYCPKSAIVAAFNDKWDDLEIKMAEYAAAVVAAQTCFHVAIAIDITPHCDCFPGNDAPGIPNVGMFASFDPVALDQAVTDAISATPVIEGGSFAEKYAACEDAADHFHANNPLANWELQVEHAAELGAGTRSYELIEVK